jgi:hypothetical protein
MTNDNLTSSLMGLALAVNEEARDRARRSTARQSPRPVHEHAVLSGVSDQLRAMASIIATLPEGAQ